MEKEVFGFLIHANQIRPREWQPTIATIQAQPNETYKHISDIHI